jgi:cell division protein FtsW (lipid II flippase)
MKYYQIIFWILKILAIAGLLLIYSGYIDTSNSVYQIIDNLLKVLIGIFIIYLFTFYSFPMIDFHDLIIIQVGGYLLLFSAFTKT